MEDVREEVDAEKRRLRLANDALEAQIAGLTSALERERITHARECERMEERQRELEQKVHHERLHEVRQSTSALEAQLIDAQKNEEALRSRLGDQQLRRLLAPVRVPKPSKSFRKIEQRRSMPFLVNTVTVPQAPSSTLQALFHFHIQRLVHLLGIHLTRNNKRFR